jgi:hypothetical protein
MLVTRGQPSKNRRFGSKHAPALVPKFLLAEPYLPFPLEEALSSSFESNFFLFIRSKLITSFFSVQIRWHLERVGTFAGILVSVSAGCLYCTRFFTVLRSASERSDVLCEAETWADWSGIVYMCYG